MTQIDTDWDGVSRPWQVRRPWRIAYHLGYYA
jgi:hypothetical protein